MGVEMNFDFGEVLSRAWQITWKHKVLWIIGILFAFFISTMIPLMSSPVLFPVLTLISAGSLIFTISVWALTYLRLTRSPKLQLLLPEATS
jgi:hypothetical protein